MFFLLMHVLLCYRIYIFSEPSIFTLSYTSSFKQW